ncbi:MAG: hypothetical protein WBN89_16780 [Prochlorococcaceae cyanobacterium]
MSQSEHRGDPEEIIARAEELLHELDQPTPQPPSPSPSPSPSSAPIAEGKDRKSNNGLPAASSDLTSPSRNLPPDASSTLRQPQATTPPPIPTTLLIALLGFGVLLVIALAFEHVQNAQAPTKIQTYTPPSAGSNIDLIQERLNTAREHGESAVLICEHQKVIDAFEGMNFASASQLQVNEKNSLLARAQGAIKALDAPGRHEYHERCDLGIGFQLYDQYNWEAGNDFVGSFFGVASKKCAAPAIQVNAYRDKEYKQLLFSDWFPFTPDPATGVAKKVQFRIPAAKLTLDPFWYDFNFRC